MLSVTNVAFELCVHHMAVFFVFQIFHALVHISTFSLLRFVRASFLAFSYALFFPHIFVYKRSFKYLHIMVSDIIIIII